MVMVQPHLPLWGVVAGNIACAIASFLAVAMTMALFNDHYLVLTGSQVKTAPQLFGFTA